MPDPNVVQHFSQAAAGYTRLRGTWPLGAVRRQEQQAVEALARIRPGDWVLDAGCGDGETLAWVQALGAHAVGVDCSFAMAAASRRRGHRVCVQDMDALGLRACFDWVLCVGALEFTADPARAVRNLAGCLRRGGHLLLLFPRRGVWGALYQAYHRRHGVPVRLFSRDDIRSLLSLTELRAGEPWRDCWLSTVVAATRVSDGDRS
jgi:SAM-dependent methyltransferase